MNGRERERERETKDNRTTRRCRWSPPPTPSNIAFILFSYIYFFSTHFFLLVRQTRCNNDFPSQCFYRFSSIMFSLFSLNVYNASSNRITRLRQYIQDAHLVVLVCRLTRLSVIACCTVIVLSVIHSGPRCAVF